VSARDAATELDRRIAAALKATAGSIGPLGGTVKRLNNIHQTLKAQLATGELTDPQYAQKVRDLLNINRQLRRPHCRGRASTGVISLRELNPECVD
jgi:hypothetical protein